jgi:predicted peptidase
MLVGVRAVGCLWLAAAVAAAQAQGSASSSAPDSGSIRLVPGRTVLPPLKGVALSNHTQCVARLGRYPKEVPSEVRISTDSSAARASMRYYLFRPAEFDPNRSYPLVVSLHGAKPKQFEHLLEGGELGFAYGLGRLVSPDEQRRHPAFVVAPWSGGQTWVEEKLRLVRGIIETLSREFRIDRNRIYVTGQSMGGYGTWAILAQYPDLFAAAVPICGGGDPSEAHRFKHVAIWAFHGTADTIVSVNQTRQMIAALLRAGGQPIYWEYQQTSHAQTAERAYCEPGLLDWLFAQRRH